MFGGNLPVDIVDWPHGSPADRWQTFVQIVAEAPGLDDAQREALFNANCERFYRI